MTTRNSNSNTPTPTMLPESTSPRSRKKPDTLLISPIDNRSLTIYFQGLQLLEDQMGTGQLWWMNQELQGIACMVDPFGESEYMVVDTGGVLNIATSQADVMEELAITTTIGMDGIPLASREAAVARMASMIERQATAAVEEASVIIFLVDGQLTSVNLHVKDSCKHQSFGHWGLRIAERMEREGKGCLIVVNKWDTIPNKNEQDVREKIRVLDWAPIVYSTAIAGHNVENTVEKERSRRLSTSILNQVVQESVAFKSPPRTRGGKRGRVYYCTQAAIRPPTFVFFVNDAKLFPETYWRYMEKQLRTDAGFAGTPIRLLWRSRRKMEKDEGRAARTQSNLVPRDSKLELAS
ncbi:uncharacterized protein LOC126717488 isoform X2 [Quercus robur]|uniref:uncharacterized protein LOC126717488 isoform X2 n=1 Tax=Quercus robur TaxID=38942 RepID=UPI00216366BF|nr:uncharacterized protein LOC126717488 isoform X2 [Quercus robur]